MKYFIVVSPVHADDDHVRHEDDQVGQEPANTEEEDGEGGGLCILGQVVKWGRVKITLEN